jgi:hypothetical protein
MNSKDYAMKVLQEEEKKKSKEVKQVVGHFYNRLRGPSHL